MKTYHVFIASSLSFQKERDLMEKGKLSILTSCV